MNINKIFSKQFFGSVGLSLLARIIGIINIILIIPLVINNYSVEEFAFFSIMIQLITIYGFLDLGIGNILINEIVYYRNKGYFKILRTVVYQSLKFLAIIAVGLIIIVILIYNLFGVQILSGKFDVNLIEKINTNYFKLIVVFFIILPTTLIQKVQFGFLDNMIFHLSEVFQKSFQIFVIYYLVKNNYSVVDLVFYFYFIIFITNIINLLYYFLVLKKQVFKKLNIVKKTYIPSLIKKSFYFFLGSIFFFFSRTLDTYLISFYGSFEYLKDYEIIKRPYDIGLTTLMIVTSVLWPILAEANFKKEFKKIKKLLNLTFIGVIIGMIFLMIFMIVYGNPLLQLWINDYTLNYSNEMFLLVGVVFLLFGIGNILVTYLNSISVFFVQLIIYVILAFIGIPIKIYVLSNYGLKDYFIALIVLLTIFYVTPMYIITRKKLNKK